MYVYVSETQALRNRTLLLFKINLRSVRGRETESHVSGWGWLPKTAVCSALRNRIMFSWRCDRPHADNKAILFNSIRQSDGHCLHCLCQGNHGIYGGMFKYLKLTTLEVITDIRIQRSRN